MKSILIIDTPKNCPDCQLMADGWNACIDEILGETE